MKPTGVKEFLKQKNVTPSLKTYFIDAMGAMAFGLFASLLIGTIFATLGEKTGIQIFNTIAEYAKGATGAALGVSIAYALKAPQLVLLSAATVGIAGNALGGPVGAFVASIIAVELGKIVSKETRVDILVTPGVTIISGVFMAQFVGPGVSAFMTAFGHAPDGQHRKKSQDLAASHLSLHDHRPSGHHGLSHGKHPRGRRHGNLRPGRPYRRVHCHGRRRGDVDRHPAGVFCVARHPYPDIRGSAAQTGVDQGRGLKAGTVKPKGLNIRFSSGLIGAMSCPD